MKVEDLLTLSKLLRLRHARIQTNNLVASCPFAPYRHLKADGTYGIDRRPSFGISVTDYDESVYNCFACQSSGDMLRLCFELSDLRGHDYTDIVDWVWKTEDILEQALAPQPSPAAIRAAKIEERELAVYQEAEYEPYRRSVPRYAMERGLDLRACKAWDLGHDPEEGRLLFPVRRRDGKLVGLKGRSYRGHEAKYFPYLDFSQGSYFYGEHMLLEGDHRLVVVEGEIDVIKVWMSGHSCWGLMGGMATAEHKRKLEVLGWDLVLMPDPNKVGERWARRLGDHFKSLVNVYDVFLKKGDPGVHEPEELDELVENAGLRL